MSGQDEFDGYKPYFGKVVRVVLPVRWPDGENWHNGLLEDRAYVGRVCTHYEGGACLQPPGGAECIPLTAGMKLEILPGKLDDYT